MFPSQVHRTLLHLPLILGTSLLFPVKAEACPFCDGGPSGRNEVREAIFGSDFGLNLFYMALPFAVFIGLVLLIHFGPPAWPGGSRPEKKNSTPDPTEY